jgi:hypothetical protein
MSEKIHFHGFIRKPSLQVENLFAQHQFPSSAKRWIRFVDSIAPIIGDPATNPELSRKARDVPAHVHPFNCLS